MSGCPIAASKKKKHLHRPSTGHSELTEGKQEPKEELADDSEQLKEEPHIDELPELSVKQEQQQADLLDAAHNGLLQLAHAAANKGILSTITDCLHSMLVVSHF